MALIFGIAGALRREEFVNLKVTDVIIREDLLYIEIPNTKNKVPRCFVISGSLFDICYQYIQARPQISLSERFFLKYFKGKCQNSPIGINKFGAMPKEVALYLNLPDAEKYTVNNFRRTSATLLVDAGADITTLKRHGGWRSSTVAEGYVADSLNNKKRICEQISTGIILNKKSKLANIVPTVPETQHIESSEETRNTTATIVNSKNETDLSNEVQDKVKTISSLDVHMKHISANVTHRTQRELLQILELIILKVYHQALSQIQKSCTIKMLAYTY